MQIPNHFFSFSLYPNISFVLHTVLNIPIQPITTTTTIRCLLSPPQLQPPQFKWCKMHPQPHHHINKICKWHFWALQIGNQPFSYTSLNFLSSLSSLHLSKSSRKSYSCSDFFKNSIYLQCQNLVYIFRAISIHKDRRKSEAESGSAILNHCGIPHVR